MKLVLFILWSCLSISASKRVYMNTWIVKTFEGEDFAKSIAQEHGFTYIGLAPTYTDHYIFKKEDLEKLSKHKRTDLTKEFMKHEKVMWAGQQKLKRVSKMFTSPKDKDESKTKKLKRTVRAYGNEGASSSSGRRGFPTTPSSGFLDTYEGPTKSIILSSVKSSVYRYEYNDKDWAYQWYAIDYRVVDGPVMDHNVVPVYRGGITGRGVTVGVLDRAVDATHPDLAGQVIAELSHDYLDGRAGVSRGGKHGTNVAGVIAMLPNNKRCGVGVAYGAQIASLKVMGGKTEPSDLTFGMALGHAQDKIDIYSNSWNGDTQGKYFDEANHMELESMRRGVIRGRGGLGAVYVFGTGNLKSVGDNCAFDGIVNDPYVILVGAATNLGKVTHYASACAHVFVTAYSGDGIDDDNDDPTGVSEPGVVTTSLKGKCTTEFEGTSAAVPIISGIIALVLQANPRLGYRDVQHLITMSAEVAPLADNRGTWSKNKAGFWISSDFGFGLMNALNMVNLARTWTNVKPQIICVGELNFYPPKQFSSEWLFALPMVTDACKNTQNEITFLEKVVITVTINYPAKRNDLLITLFSPQGTQTKIIRPRQQDESRLGIIRWSVTSVQTWGENPSGKWTMVIQNRNNKPLSQPNNEWSSSSATKRQRTLSTLTSSTISRTYIGTIDSFKLTWYGMAKPPDHLARGPRVNYAGFRV